VTHTIRLVSQSRWSRSLNVHSIYCDSEKTMQLTIVNSFDTMSEPCSHPLLAQKSLEVDNVCELYKKQIDAKHFVSLQTVFLNRNSTLSTSSPTSPAKRYQTYYQS